MGQGFQEYAGGSPLCILNENTNVPHLKMNPNGIFLYEGFAYSDLKYIFAVPKGGAIAHPDSYREVEQ